MKVLCVGDIHLGRQPSRLPSEVLEHISARQLSPAGAWARAVDEALRQKVDAVLLAGDVVEQNDDFYEAYVDLHEGIERLTAKGIQVLAVAGNHDVQVLPRLADSLPAFYLLGRDGQWETRTLEGADGTRLRVLGWSFPQDVVRTSPLADRLPERDATTTIGLLHCDRDQTGSRHAPVRSTELDDAPVDGWLLGHIHKPDALSGPRPIGYLGSLTAMDPGEAGAHGPWLLEASGSAELKIEHIPLAPLRWERRNVPLDELEHPEDVHNLVTAALDTLHTEITLSGATPLVVGCRFRFTGRTPFREALARVLAADDPRQTPHERNGVIYFVDDWRLEALPAIELEEIAEGTDPVGLLARKLLLLRGPDSPERRELVGAMQRRFADKVRERNYAALSAEPPDPQQTSSILENAALRALDMLLAQRGKTG